MIVGYGYTYRSDGVAPSVMIVLSAEDIAAIMSGEIVVRSADEETAQVTVWFAPTEEVAMRLMQESGMLAPDVDIRRG